MPDPFLVAIAAALAGKTAGAAASRGASAFRSLVSLVRRKFGTGSAAAASLDAAQAEPDDEKVAALGEALETAARDDPEFAERLKSLWGQVQNELRADRGGVVNEVSGTVGGHAVQARDITGGVSFGEVPRRDRTGG
jgi:hypothetical protein